MANTGTFVDHWGLNKMKDEMERKYEGMSRNDFMNFFRNDENLNTLSDEDRREIFLQILPGKSDITKELLEDLLSDYDVENLEIIETKRY